VSVTEKWKRIAAIISSIIVPTFLGITIAYGWGGTGHRIINLKAPMHLPDAMAALKADSLFYRAHASDADNRKDQNDPAFFAEYWRHFIDIDIYPDYLSLPHNLDSVIQRYGQANVRANGTLPWATLMTFDSLVAQLSRNDTMVKYTMSDLGHYVGDGHQPLHCTANYNGQFTGNDGIHSNYESGMIGIYQSFITINPALVEYVSSPLDYIFAYIYHSNSLVDSILLADTYAKSQPSNFYYAALWEKTQNLTRDEFQRATVALASLWYTAWVNAHPVNQNFIIASSVGAGTISPSGSVSITSGHDTSFVFTSNIGHHIDSVKVDGNKVDSLTGYTFHDVTASHTIAVWFGINRYAITSSAGPHGTIIPAGITMKNYGSTQSFTISPDLGYIIDSLFVDGAAVDTTTNLTIVNITGEHTIYTSFIPIPALVQCSFSEKWNLISVPVTARDFRKTVLFPTTVSQAFSFKGSYLAKDTLNSKAGYWLKFHNDTLIQMSGSSIYDDTIDVIAGWNLLGSISTPIAVSLIKSIPGGLITTSFFTYKKGYITADSIIPGRGYWVKVKQSGKLVLSSSTFVTNNNLIKIVSDTDMPPSPPGEAISETPKIPMEFSLAQNFPNPFNPSTVIQYQVPGLSKIMLKIFNTLGQEVKTLVDEIQDAGYKSVEWNSTDNTGNAVPSGMYFYQLHGDGFVATKKLLLMR
jgi:hypothetical protein